MDTLDSIFVAVFLNVNDSLEIDVIAKSVLTVDFENRSKFTTGVLPRPVGANMDSNTTGGRIKSVTIDRAIFVFIQSPRGRIFDSKSISGARESLIVGNGSR